MENLFPNIYRNFYLRYRIHNRNEEKTKKNVNHGDEQSLH